MPEVLHQHDEAMDDIQVKLSHALEALQNVPAGAASKAKVDLFRVYAKQIAQAVDRAAQRERCCGVIYEHGGLTSARPCHDCPGWAEVLR